MKKLFKFKYNTFLVFSIILFMIISLLTVNSSSKLLNNNSLIIKQFIWYIVGFIIIAIIIIIGNKQIYKYSWHIYIIGNISLLLLLIFGPTINNSKCWFVIPGIGTIQPSEFMKIALIIINSKLINEFNKKKYTSIKDEFKFILKMSVVVLIPSILTFLEPDTGVVIIYLIITFIMLFISGIRYRWFVIVLILLSSLISFILLMYFLNNDLFIDMFGTSFFLRIDRLIDWKNNTGYQLTNSLCSIGSGGLFGYGLNNTPIYFPEPQTDFIFAVFGNNFGFVGASLLIIFLCTFDIKLILLSRKTKGIDKYIISGVIGMILYQQFQNIGMTYGVIPITGITLPFISYGGSSLLSYMIVFGIILNISNDH